MDTSGKGGVLSHTVGLVDPQGVRITSFKAPTEEELRPRLPVADRAARCPTPGYIGVFDRSHYEDVLIVRVRELAPAEEIERRYDAINEFEQRAGRRRARRWSSACCTSRAEEQKERLLARLDDPTQALEVQPRRRRRARPLAATTARPTRSRWSGPTPSTRPGTSIPSDRKWYRNLADRPSSCSRRCAALDPHWPAAGLRRRRSSARRLDAARHRVDVIDTVAATRYVDAAARGRLAARASSRPTTSAPTSASSAAPARGCGCWSPRWSSASSPARSGSAPRELVAVELDPAIARYEADEEVQDLLNASLGLNLGVDFLPGSFGFDAGLPSRDPEVGGPGALAGRLRRQRRPLLAQPQPARLARRPVGDRPRRRAVLPPRLARRASATRSGSPAQPWDAGDHVLRRLRGRPAARSTPRLAALVDERAARRRAGAGPRRVARAGARRRDAGRAAGGVRRLPHRPARRPASGCRRRCGHERVPRLAYQYVVLRCVPRVDREEFVNVGRGALLPGRRTSSRPRWHVDRDRLRGAAPRRRPRPGVPRAGVRGRRVRGGRARRRGRRAKPLGPRASASCARRRAPSSSPAPCTAGTDRADPAAELDSAAGPDTLVPVNGPLGPQTGTSSTAPTA